MSFDSTLASGEMPVMVEEDAEDVLMFQSESDEEDEPVEHGDKQMFVFTSDEEDECASSARIMQNEASSRRSGDEQLGPDSSDTETDTEDMPG